MNPKIKKIIETKTFLNSNNETIQVHSETGLSQCVFLQEIIVENGFKKSLEIGLAYGFSAAAILDEISKLSGQHIAIDKFQTAHWGGNGVDLVRSLGFSDSFNFYEDYSYKVLPRLLDKGLCFDFVYIDTTKLLDYLMVDFFFIDKLLADKGVIVFDDVDFPSIRKLLRYIAQLPHYEVYKTFPVNRKYAKPKQLLINLFKSLPKSETIFNNRFLKTDFDLGISASCVAFRKLKSDDRNYDWHISF